jgi:hypothetical protein
VTTDGAGHDPLIGQELGHYRSVTKIGGSKGVVYKTEDANLHRLVALKFLSEDIARGTQAVSSLASEHQLMSHARVCLGRVASRQSPLEKGSKFRLQTIEVNKRRGR